jgi:ABC-type methionine transport system ATPase subunit
MLMVLLLSIVACSLQAGLMAKPLTALNVQKHLEDFGLEPEFSTHSLMRGLSGGQKVKVVLGAAMWNNPHILVSLGEETTCFADIARCSVSQRVARACGTW